MTTLPTAFVEKLTESLNDLKFKLSYGYSSSKRTSKTPQKVTNFMDYNFGKYIGSIMGMFDSYFVKLYGRKMDDVEYEEFVTYFIDRQDEIAELFYKLKNNT